MSTDTIISVSGRETSSGAAEHGLCYPQCHLARSSICFLMKTLWKFEQSASTQPADNSFCISAGCTLADCTKFPHGLHREANAWVMVSANRVPVVTVPGTVYPEDEEHAITPSQGAGSGLQVLQLVYVHICTLGIAHTYMYVYLASLLHYIPGTAYVFDGCSTQVCWFHWLE